MKTKNIWKEAGILLIIAILVLSTVAATANTSNENVEASTSLTACGNSEIVAKSALINSAYEQCGNRAELWNNGLPDGRNGCSCVYWPSYPMDREIIDNFEVTGLLWKVCDGHFRVVTYSGAGPEIITAVRVYFYGSTGPCEPDVELFAERYASFNAYLTGGVYFERPEIAIDCEFECVDLTPGEWWVCFQPEMEDNNFWLTAGGDDCSIFAAYPDKAYDKWTKGYPTVFTEEYDVSFILTGEQIGEPQPDLDCQGSLVWIDQKPADTLTGNFSIGNIGDAGSTLNWKVKQYPTWGTWTFNPSNGAQPPGWKKVDVVVIAPTDKNQNLSGKVILENTDDPTDVCEIEVQLTTPKTKAFNLYMNLLNWLLEQFPILKFILGI